MSAKKHIGLAEKADSRGRHKAGRGHWKQALNPSNWNPTYLSRPQRR